MTPGVGQKEVQEQRQGVQSCKEKSYEKPGQEKQSKKDENYHVERYQGA